MTGDVTTHWPGLHLVDTAPDGSCAVVVLTLMLDATGRVCMYSFEPLAGRCDEARDVVNARLGFAVPVREPPPLRVPPSIASLVRRVPRLFNACDKFAAEVMFAPPDTTPIALVTSDTFRAMGIQIAGIRPHVRAYELSNGLRGGGNGGQG